MFQTKVGLFYVKYGRHVNLNESAISPIVVLLLVPIAMGRGDG
jgi:hypothetical protein